MCIIYDQIIRPSLWRAFFYAYGGPYAVAAFLKVFADLLQFSQPQLLRFLLAFIASYQRDPAHTSILPGFGWCAALFLTALIQTAILHQYFQLCFVTGSRVRAGLVMVIYNKSLVLSNDEDDTATKEDHKDQAGEKKEGRSRGDVVNLMSVDTSRMQDLCTYALIIASGPFQASVISSHSTRILTPWCCC
jgi:ATP-binding cassette subfamily C (CFTR/MRP) protein 1